MTTRPLFTPDWPRYAVAAHAMFWTASALLLAGGVGAAAGFVHGQTVIWLFAVWIAFAFVLGGSATISGKLYAGNQVFTRTPTTGWRARIHGAFVCMGSGALILFGYALTQWHGG